MVGDSGVVCAANGDVPRRATRQAGAALCICQNEWRTLETMPRAGALRGGRETFAGARAGGFRRAGVRGCLGTR